MYKKVSHTGTFFRGCDHECGDINSEGLPVPYCWAKKIHTVSHEPHFIGHGSKVLRLRDAYIFLNSAHDSFAKCIPNEWICEMINWIAAQHPSNKFLIQTKNTPRMLRYALPYGQGGFYMGYLEAIQDQIVLGTTAETNRDYLYHGNAPGPTQRMHDMLKMRRAGFEIMLSLEPIMDFDLTMFYNHITMVHPDYIEIGPDNYRCGLQEPSYSKAKHLIEMLRAAGIEIIEKDGLEKLNRK